MFFPPLFVDARYGVSCQDGEAELGVQSSVGRHAQELLRVFWRGIHDLPD